MDQPASIHRQRGDEPRAAGRSRRYGCGSSARSASSATSPGTRRRTSVCDGGAAMPCLMWRDCVRGLRRRAAVRELVEVTGRSRRTCPRGGCSSRCAQLRHAGEGELRLRVAELARARSSRGSCGPNASARCRAYPQRIAVVTSPRGKAVHDVIRTLRRRYPLAELLIAGVAVEGENAPDEIVAGCALGGSGPDVMILVRGGGSYEDLMPFNAEVVARASRRCRSPSSPASATSRTRASPTWSPTCGPRRRPLPPRRSRPRSPSSPSTLDRERRMLGRALAHTVQDAAHRVLRLAERPGALARPRPCSVPLPRRSTPRRSGSREALPRRLARRSERLERDRAALVAHGQAEAARRRERRSRMSAARPQDLSPLAILSRGYAVCYAADGRTVVRALQQVAPGDSVAVRLGRGPLGSHGSKPGWRRGDD